MKKILIIGLLIIAVSIFTGCGGSSGPNLIGNWSWTQQQTQPAPQTYTGTMSVTSASGNQFSGTISWISPQPGGPFTFTGQLNGNAATINYVWGITTETWNINFTGNNFSGSWVAGNFSGSISGNKI